MQIRFYPVTHLDLIGRNVVALEALGTIRTPVYPTPRLSTGRGNRIAEGETTPNSECRRRMRRRELYEQLSRYHALPNGYQEWHCPELLSRGKYNRGRFVQRQFTYLHHSVLWDVERIPRPPAAAPGPDPASADGPQEG